MNFKRLTDHDFGLKTATFLPTLSINIMIKCRATLCSSWFNNYNVFFIETSMSKRRVLDQELKGNGFISSVCLWGRWMLWINWFFWGDWLGFYLPMKKYHLNIDILAILVQEVLQEMRNRLVGDVSTDDDMSVCGLPTKFDLFCSKIKRAEWKIIVY